VSPKYKANYLLFFIIIIYLHIFFVTEPIDVVFLVDRSFSMRGGSLAQCARAVSYLLEPLTEKDGVQVCIRNICVVLLSCCRVVGGVVGGVVGVVGVIGVVGVAVLSCCRVVVLPYCRVSVFPCFRVGVLACWRVGVLLVGVLRVGVACGVWV
jgi:hypothetical protein